MDLLLHSVNNALALAKPRLKEGLQLAQADGFRDVIVCASPHGISCDLCTPAAGYANNYHVRIMVPDLVAVLQPRERREG